MDHRDLDRWARLVASSCSRRRTLKVVAAGVLALGLGRRSRFEALATDLSCCKCSGTLSCVMNVESYDACANMCAPRQAIFAPNYTCAQGNVLRTVCKPKRRATGAVLLAGVPGAYDLAFVDRAGAATIAGLFPVTTEALFTAAAAIAAGFVREAAAAALFEEGVQVYHSLWQDAGETIGVFSHLSQHLTAEAATRWYDYALPQLGPEGAETFEFELSGIDAGALIRFAFASQTQPGVTITRLMAMTLTGEFVNWFGIDGRDTIPDPELARAFAQAVVDALIDRPEQTASLAPYVALLPQAAACLPAFPVAAAKRTGASAARGPAGFQDPSAECEAPTGNIRYTFWNGAYVPPLGTPEGVIELNQDFFAGADRVLDQSYAVGNQIRTVTIANWWHPDVIADDGRIFFERRAELDAARGAIRQELDLTHEGATGQWFCTAFAFPAGEQWVYGVDAVAFAPPYSLSLGILEPGEPPEEQGTWSVDGRIITDMAALGSSPGAYDFESFADLTTAPATSPTFFDSRYSSPPQGDEVVSGRRDFGAAIAALQRSPHMAGFGDDPENGTTYHAATPSFQDQLGGFAPDVMEPLFSEQGLLQVRVDWYGTRGNLETLRLDEYQFPDRASAEAGFDKVAGALAQRGQADLTVEIPGQPRSFTVRSNVEVDDREAVRHETVVLVGEIVVVATYSTVNPQTDPTERLTAVLGDLLAAYDDDAWAGEVGVAVQPVTPWMPWMTGVVEFQDDLIVVDGVSYGDDPDRTAAANPGVQTARVGSFRLTDPSEIEVQWGVRSFTGTLEATTFLELIPDHRPEFNWSAGQPHSFLADAVPHVVRGVTTTREDGVPLVGAHVAIRADETIVFDLAALVPYTGDPAAFAGYDPTTDPRFGPLSNGIASTYLTLDDFVDKAQPRLGFYWEPMLEPPASWFEIPVADPVVEAGGEADPTLLRDFGATAAALGLSSALSGYKASGGDTYVTTEAALEILWEWFERVGDDATKKEDFAQEFFTDQGLLQMRADRFIADDESETFDLTQLQVVNLPGATSAISALRGRVASEYELSALSSLGRGATGFRWRSQVEDGDEVYNVDDTLVQYDNFLITGRYRTPGHVTSSVVLGRIDAVYQDLLNSYNPGAWAGEVGQAVRPVVPWGPIVKDQDWLFYHYPIVNREVLPRAGGDAAQTAAENPWVRTLLSGRYDLTGAWTQIELTYDVRDFPDQEASDRFWERWPELMQDDSSGVKWRPTDELSLNLGVSYRAYGGTRTLDDGRFQVGADLAFQVGTTTVGLRAFVDYTGDPESFTELERNPLVDTSYLRLSEGLPDLGSQLYASAASESEREYTGNLSSYRSALPRAWLPSFVMDDREEADSTLLRDFLATEAVAGGSTFLEDYQIPGGTTFLTPSSLDSPSVQEYVVGAAKRLAGKGYLQAHASSYLLPSTSNTDEPQATPTYENLFLLNQVQLTDEASAGEWFDAFKEELAYPGAEEVTVPRIGLTWDVPNVSYRFQFRTDEGQEIDRVNTVVRAGRYVATSTFDTIGTGQVLPEGTIEHVNAVYDGVYADLLGAYDERNWAGEVGQEARRVTPWIPFMETVQSYGAYLAIISGIARPRYGVDPERMAAENPGVRTALFGNYFLTGTWTPIAVYFDVRDFPDQEASDQYFEQLPDLFQTYSGPDWIFAQSSGEYVEALVRVRHHEHAATWHPAEGVYLVGTHLATQVGTTVVGLGAFVDAEYTGDPAKFDGYDPSNHPRYPFLTAGVFTMTEELIEQREESIASSSYYLGNLGQPRLKVPEEWR